MNATELFHKDGRPAGVWYCGKCRLSFSHREPAEQCCLPNPCVVCGKPCERMFYTTCDSCRSAQRIAREHERYTKAVKLTEWDGWVYVEDMGFQDGYFQDIDELELYCLEDGAELPRYAWTCSTKPLVHVEADDIYYCVFMDSEEDRERYRIKGFEEIGKAVGAFNEANKHLLTYQPDFTRCVLMKQAQANEINESPHLH